jgi:hypothetical protein
MVVVAPNIRVMTTRILRVVVDLAVTKGWIVRVMMTRTFGVEADLVG